MPDKEKTYKKEPSMTEEFLNSLLRRADWRFLLSNPKPQKSICYSGGALASAVDFISDTLIEPGSGARDCDLAVAINPELETLQAGLTSLRPGGIFYMEYNVNAHFNPESIKRKLELLGFDRIEMYLPKPPPEQSSSGIWIPLESQEAVNFSIMSSSKNKNTRTLIRVLKLIQRKTWQLMPGLFMNYPWFISSFLMDYVISIIACKPEDPNEKISFEDRSLQKSGTDHIELDLNNSFLTGVRLSQDNSLGTKDISGGVYKLMLTQGIHSSNKIIFFVFSETAQEPLFVLKTTRVSDSDRELENEANTLKALEDNNVDISGIPKVLFTNTLNGSYMVGESFIEGTFLKDKLSNNNYRELALKAKDMLVALADKTKTLISPDIQNNLVDSIMKEFFSLYAQLSDQKLIDITKERLRSFSLEHQYCEHRDFSPWNVLLMQNGELGALDWESSVIKGLPATDLIYFLTYLSVYLENAHEKTKFVECYSKLIDDNTYTGSVFKECTSSYMNRLGIDYSNINLLRLITWMIHAPSEYRDMGFVPDAALKSEQLRSSIFYNLWEYELTGSCRLKSKP